MLKRIAGRLAPQVALPRASVAPLSKKFVHSQDAEETPLKTLQQTPSSFHGKGLEDATVQTMMDVAFAAKENSWSPYSNFRVGAAVLGKSGKIYPGTNMENASYGLTICAERIALGAAVSSGEKEMKAICVVTDAKTHTWCCGACCAVTLEFGEHMLVYSATENRDYQLRNIKELMPFAFSRADLDESNR